MGVTIPLDKMTTADKLQALEDLWSDLLRSPEEVPSPAWHEDVLKARSQRAREGASQFSDWSDAKRRLDEQNR